MAMPSTDASTLPTTARERRWSLAAAIASVTVFGLSVGQGGPLLPLLLEQRGTDATLNGLNAGATFIGVIIGPLLAPRLRAAVRHPQLPAGLLRPRHRAVPGDEGVRQHRRLVRAARGAGRGRLQPSSRPARPGSISSPATSGRGRIIGIYAAALSAGFGIGPLILSLTGIEGWPPFLVNAAITALATLPLLGIGDASRGFGRERGASPLRMFARAPVIVGDRGGVRPVRVGADGAAADLGRAQRPDRADWRRRTLSAVYFGSIVLQVLIGWLSDRVSRLAALRLCGAVGLVGALALLSVPASPLVLFGLLFVWGGVASGIYPVALSMAGDRFRGGDLVSVNAAMIIAYGLGGAGRPAAGRGWRWISRNPQGLLWLFVVLFTALLGGSLLISRSHRAGPGPV